MDGGASICREAGIIVAGGHSIDSQEAIYGLGEWLVGRRMSNGGIVLMLIRYLGFMMMMMMMNEQWV